MLFKAGIMLTPKPAFVVLVAATIFLTIVSPLPLCLLGLLTPLFPLLVLLTLDLLHVFLFCCLLLLLFLLLLGMLLLVLFLLRLLLLLGVLLLLLCLLLLLGMLLRLRAILILLRLLMSLLSLLMLLLLGLGLFVRVLLGFGIILFFVWMILPCVGGGGDSEEGRQKCCADYGGGFHSCSFCGCLSVTFSLRPPAALTTGLDSCCIASQRSLTRLPPAFSALNGTNTGIPISAIDGE